MEIVDVVLCLVFWNGLVNVFWGVGGEGFLLLLIFYLYVFIYIWID